jgi:hypothetical protein
MWCTPKLLNGLNCEFKGENNERRRSWGAFPNSQHFEGRGACWGFEMRLGWTTRSSIIHMDMYKPNNKLVSTELEHFWCTNEPWANTDPQDSPRPKLGGSHHLPPYSILCAWPWGQHPNVTLFRDCQVGVPKFLKLGLPQLWKPITLCTNLWLRWFLKKSCNPCHELSNNMWHATKMQWNQGDLKLLVVGSQIGNLSIDPSFGHNLCFKYPNGSCKPILDICVPRDFQ